MTELVLDPIKTKHRALWALGNYDRVAVDVVSGLGPVLVEAAGVHAGQYVLDVAAGTGNASIPAAQTGATVVATDLTPELLETGRQRVGNRGLALSWQEADAEHLPFGDAEFDVTLSCIGAMFAPFHQPVADELVRVTKPGGRIGLINWTPDGFIGRLFATMKPFAAAPPAGASPGPLWGQEAHVAELFGERVSLVTERRNLPVSHFASGAEFRDFFTAYYGPVIATYRNVADDPSRTAALDQTLIALGDDALTDGTMQWEYLIAIADIH